MSGSEEQLELNDDLSRHLLAPGSKAGLSLIKEIPEVSVRARGNCLYLSGNKVKIELVKRFIDVLSKRLESADALDPFEMKRLFEQFTGEEAPALKHQPTANGKPFEEIIVSSSGRSVCPKTFSQQFYTHAIAKNVVTIARGPAGTGKTYLATAMAVKALKEKSVSKVILSRPVVEAGENLGYLPGDLKEKVDPHFRPLYDCLQEFLGPSRFEQLLRQGKIEITPLAYMRGRTFNESFVVLDEAQNTTMPQMQMILTRLGYGSKMVITGDHTQIDLPRIKDSSLLNLEKILGEVDLVEFIDLGAKDVIRHDIVKKIIKAFESYKNRDTKRCE